MVGKLYPFRNLPCDCAADPWYVSGREIDDHGCTIGAGVLEWCYSREDANHRMKLMEQYPHQFVELAIGEP